MKNLTLSILAIVFLLTPSFLLANPLADNVDVKFMQGIKIDPGIGGSADTVLLPKKLNWFAKPGIILGLGSRIVSADQTGQDLVLHAGLGPCLWESFCGSMVYDFQAHERFWLFDINMMNLYDLMVGKDEKENN